MRLEWGDWIALGLVMIAIWIVMIAIGIGGCAMEAGEIIRERDKCEKAELGTKYRFRFNDDTGTVIKAYCAPKKERESRYG